MRRRLLLCTVLYLVAGNGCPRCEPVKEYCDDTQDRCSPCSRLCHPGQGTDASCHRLCPEYARNTKNTARDSKLTVQPEPSSPSPPAPHFPQSLVWGLLAVLVVIALVLLAVLVLYVGRCLHSRRNTQTQVAANGYLPCPEGNGHANTETNGDVEEGRRGRNVICPGGPSSPPRAVPTSWDSRTDKQDTNTEWELPESP